MSRAASAFSISSTETIFCVVEPRGPVGLALLLLEVDLRLAQLGLGLRRRIACRDASIAFSSLCSRTARTSPLLDLRALLDEHPLDPARDLGADHRLVPRLEVTLGAEQLLGLAGGHRLDQADGRPRAWPGSARTGGRRTPPATPSRPSGISQIRTERKPTPRSPRPAWPARDRAASRRAAGRSSARPVRRATSPPCAPQCLSTVRIESVTARYVISQSTSCRIVEVDRDPSRSVARRRESKSVEVLDRAT